MRPRPTIPNFIRPPLLRDVRLPAVVRYHLPRPYGMVWENTRSKTKRGLFRRLGRIPSRPRLAHGMPAEPAFARCLQDASFVASLSYQRVTARTQRDDLAAPGGAI